MTREDHPRSDLLCQECLSLTRALDYRSGTAFALVGLASVAQAGGQPQHICRMTAYCCDKPAYLAARAELGAIWRQRMGRHYPAMAVVEVSALMEDRAKVEIETTAVIST